MLMVEFLRKEIIAIIGTPKVIVIWYDWIFILLGHHQKSEKDSFLLNLVLNILKKMVIVE